MRVQEGGSSWKESPDKKAQAPGWPDSALSLFIITQTFS